MTILHTEENKLKALKARKENALKNKAKKYPTMKAAIRAHCKRCVYDSQSGGTWLDQVNDCKVVQCELYEWRPQK